jgi:hypothetical protein
MGVNQNSPGELGLYLNTQSDAPLFQLGQDRTTIAKLSTFGTGLGIATETRNGASKTTREIDDKNRLKQQFISSQAFHRTPGGRVREPTAGERFRPRILETFDLVTQDRYRDVLLQRSTPTHTKDHTKIDSSLKTRTNFPNDQGHSPGELLPSPR